MTDSYYFCGLKTIPLLSEKIWHNNRQISSVSSDSPQHRIERLRDEEEERVRTRLQEVGMMWEDVDLERSMFWGARTDDNLTGFVRLELDLPHALLGSLYVEPEYREQGLGRRFVRYIETEAVDRDVERLFLFSTEAGEFFRDLSYDEVAVDETVDAVAEVPQVEWYRDHPDLLQKEVTFVKELASKR